MREFNTAAKRVEEPEGAVVFSVDGREMTAYPPTEGQLALFMASTGRHSNDATRLAGCIDFFVTVLDDSSHTYIVDRLMSRDDPMGLDEVVEIMRYLVEEWTGRPTKRLSVSTRSQQSGGPRLTEATQESTPSDSLPIGS